MPYTWPEAIETFPQALALINKIEQAIGNVNEDVKVTGAEMGDLLAAVGPELGRLVDKVIEDARD